MSEVERVEREHRLVEIEERRKTALSQAPADYYMDEWPPILKYDMPYLFAEIHRLTDENQELRLSAMRSVGQWISQETMLRAEIHRLREMLDLERARLEHDVEMATVVWRQETRRYEEAVTFAREWAVRSDDIDPDLIVQRDRADALRLAATDSLAAFLKEAAGGK